MSLKKIHIQIILLWIFLVLLGLNGRSYLPIDETRYVTVAWNMWLNGDYLVPYLNGIAYSHKPPLLFWLINLGWKVFGVNDWWPRLVPSLFALGSVFVTRKIAGRLWPEQISIKDNASLILIGSGLWVLYTTALMFDMLIAFFTALGIWGLLIALQTLESESTKKGWLLFALAIGGGLLAKGPTILLQLLPVALLAFWWNKDKILTAKNWYFPLLYAVLGGTAIALIWAIPAGIRGGGVYQHAIFWGQTADRMVDSFAHNRPFWWYVPIMPLLLFPWLLWGNVWQGIKHGALNDTSLRFCIAWAVPVFIAFSFISGKQIHYILPIFPAFALMIARIASHHQSHSQPSRKANAGIAIATLLIGALLIALPLYEQNHQRFTPWLQQIPLWLGGLVMLAAAVIYFIPKKSTVNAIAQLSVMSIMLVTICMFILISTAGDAYDVRPISAQLKILELSGTPVAYVGKYPGIFNFVGRLKQSPSLITADEVPAWFAAHPNGRLIQYIKRTQAISAQQVEYMQAYKGITLAILNHQQWLASSTAPNLAKPGQASDDADQ